jgi:hypothetical protein
MNVMRARLASMARWLAVFGLLLHMAVPMAHQPPGFAAPAPMAAHAVDAGGHSAHGHHGDHAASDQESPKPTKSGHDRPMQCPICQVLQLGGPALLPTAFAFQAPDIVSAVFEAFTSDFAVERFASPLQARAPPVTG